MKSKFVLALLNALFMASAYAGGLDSATSAATEVKMWLYGFLGICAFIYLMMKGAQAWGDRCPWSDFGMAIVKVAGVGAALVLTPWAWNLFA